VSVRDVIRDDLTVEELAATNPYIDIRLFKEWREKMAVIERARTMLDSVQRHRNPPVPRRAAAGP